MVAAVPFAGTAAFLLAGPRNNGPAARREVNLADSVWRIANSLTFLCITWDSVHKKRKRCVAKIISFLDWGEKRWLREG